MSFRELRGSLDPSPLRTFAPLRLCENLRKAWSLRILSIDALGSNGNSICVLGALCVKLPSGNEMRVKLLLTCLCDAFYGEVGIGAVRVLEAAGCKVSFPEGQTCCGQPPFNAGDWQAAKPIAERCLSVFAGDEPIVTASASCAAMLRDGYPMMGLAAPRAFELTEFLTCELGILRWPPAGNGFPEGRRVVFHRACHGRVLGLGDVQERLLASVPGIQLVPLADPEQCCGFGGAFSATHSHLSSEIGLEKLRKAVESGADTMVSGDMGCLMHLRGLIDRNGIPLRTAHYAQLLAEAIPS